MLVTGGLTAASMFMQWQGGQKAAQASQQQAQLSAQNAGFEMQIDQQRRQAMELDAQRKSMDVIRNAQRARATALSNAAGSGSQFGSGLQGGYGQISGQSGFNLLGINQNRMIGENIFGLNQQIDQNKMQIASLGGTLASAEGEMGFGKSLGGAIGPLSNLGIAGVNAGISSGKSIFGG